MKELKYGALFLLCLVFFFATVLAVIGVGACLLAGAFMKAAVCLLCVYVGTLGVNWCIKHSMAFD